MKKDTLKKMKKVKEKKNKRKNLVVNLLELILMKKIMMSMLSVPKYIITLVNQPKNQLKLFRKYCDHY